jgi:hypothetical protein
LKSPDKAEAIIYSFAPGHGREAGFMMTENALY